MGGGKSKSSRVEEEGNDGSEILGLFDSRREVFQFCSGPSPACRASMDSSAICELWVSIVRALSVSAVLISLFLFVCSKVMQWRMESSGLWVLRVHLDRAHCGASCRSPLRGLKGFVFSCYSPSVEVTFPITLIPLHALGVFLHLPFSSRLPPWSWASS